MARVVADGDCLLFQGSGNADKSEENEDHGKIRVWKHERWKLDYAHRVSYMEHFGPIPDGLMVRHRCHRRRCVNPEHLVLGTNSDNMKDMMEAKRGKHQFKPKDDCPF